MKDGIVADLGGGSLELALLKDGSVSRATSLPLGIVRLTAQMEGDMTLMRKEIDKQVDSVGWFKQSRSLNLVPLGGAFRAFARLNIAENRHPLSIIHGYTAAPSVIQNRIDVLARMSARSLSTLSGIAARRRESLPLTSMILGKLMERAAPSAVAFAAVGRGARAMSFPICRARRSPTTRWRPLHVRYLCGTPAMAIPRMRL